MQELYLPRNFRDVSFFRHFFFNLSLLQERCLVFSFTFVSLSFSISACLPFLSFVFISVLSVILRNSLNKYASTELQSCILQESHSFRSIFPSWNGKRFHCSLRIIVFFCDLFWLALNMIENGCCKCHRIEAVQNRRLKEQFFIFHRSKCWFFWRGK